MNKKRSIEEYIKSGKTFLDAVNRNNLLKESFDLEKTIKGLTQFNELNGNERKNILNNQSIGISFLMHVLKMNLI